MKPKRSALPVVKLALEKALAQLVLVQPRAKFAPHLPRVRKRTWLGISCTRINSLLVRFIRRKSCKPVRRVGQDFLRGVLARNAASLSGEGAIADTIAVATSSLDAIAKTVGTKTGNARLH